MSEVSARDPRIFVDGIDGDRARVVLGGDVFEVPLAMLPPGAREGWWIRIAAERCPPPADAEAADAELRRRAAKDPGGDIKL
jgi:hypothetical protein